MGRKKEDRSASPEVRLYQSGLTIKEVSAEIGIPVSTVRHRLHGAGVLRSGVAAMQVALSKGRLHGRPRVSRPCSDRTKQLIREKRLSWGEKNARGVRVTQKGYIEYTRGPNKGSREHILVIENLFGHPLPRGHVVHHIDENKSHNARHNLAPMTRRAHTRLHRLFKFVGVNPCLL